MDCARRSSGTGLPVAHDDTPLRLNLGCGPVHLEGYVNIDGFPTPLRGHTESAADRHLMVEQLDYPPNSVDEIYTSHTVEHLSRAQILKAFPLWLDILRPGAKLIVEVPDVEGIARQLLRHRREEDKDLYYYLLFGTQEFEGEFHKTGWTFARLKRALTHVGFVNFVDGKRSRAKIVNRRAYEMFSGRRWRCVLLQCEKPAHSVSQRLDLLRDMLQFDYHEQDLRPTWMRGVARGIWRWISRR